MLQTGQRRGGTAIPAVQTFRMGRAAETQKSRIPAPGAIAARRFHFSVQRRPRPESASVKSSRNSDTGPTPVTSK
jgi:hypothetical protein